MYEHPSIHLELARQRQADLIAEADMARLARQVERGPSETVAVLRSVLEGVRSLLSRRPVIVRDVVREPQLQPTT